MEEPQRRQLPDQRSAAESHRTTSTAVSAGRVNTWADAEDDPASDEQGDEETAMLRTQIVAAQTYIEECMIAAEASNPRAELEWQATLRKEAPDDFANVVEKSDNEEHSQADTDDSSLSMLPKKVRETSCGKQS